MNPLKVGNIISQNETSVLLLTWTDFRGIISVGREPGESYLQYVTFMKIFIDDLEIEELKIEDSLKSEDKGLLKQNNRGRPEGKTNSELQKEFAAIDALELGIVKSGEINDVCFKSAALYRDGENVAPETKTAILNHKYQIEDKATTKLMQTLDLFDPSDIEKPIELIMAADKLSSIVERVSGKDKNNNGQQVHLHLYNPTQKKISSYDVIDV